MNKDFTEEYVQINGITQYFIHYRASENQPVILFLHGGPGQSEAQLAYITAEYRTYCSYVFYDQRGAGKTQQKSKTQPSEITLENLIEDLRLTIQYIKQKYNTGSVILLGHSWGTMLGTSYILKYPDDVKGFIGFGQVVDIKRGEAIGYQKLQQVVHAAGSKSDEAALAKIGEDYPFSVAQADFYKEIGRFRRIQGKYKMAPSGLKLVGTFVKSPVFSLADIPAMAGSMIRNKNLMNVLYTYSILDVTDYATPVYYILGEDDWQVPSTLAAEYFERIHAPKKGLYWIKNAGHLTDLDNPSDFYLAVTACVNNIVAEIDCHKA